MALTATAERARWRRAQAVRWDERRLTTYAEYANAVKRVITLTTRLAAHQGLPSETDALPPDQALPAISAAEEERTIKWETFLLLGSKETVVAARDWHESVWTLKAIATGKVENGNVENGRWSDAMEAGPLTTDHDRHRPGSPGIAGIAGMKRTRTGCRRR